MKDFDPKDLSPTCGQCPSDPPWPWYSAVVTFIPWPFIVCMAVYILYKTSIVMLGVWLFVFFLFFVPLRYLICARCPYYGKSCSTVMGRLVVFMFAHRPGTPMATGLWLDIVSFAVLSAIPVPSALRLGGWILAVAWLFVFGSAVILLAAFGCRYCPFASCPIGRGARRVARLLGAGGGVPRQ